MADDLFHLVVEMLQKFQMPELLDTFRGKHLD